MSSIDNYSTKLLFAIKDPNLTFPHFYYNSDHLTKILVTELTLPSSICPNFQAAFKPLPIEPHKQSLYCHNCHHFL